MRTSGKGWGKGGSGNVIKYLAEKRGKDTKLEKRMEYGSSLAREGGLKQPSTCAPKRGVPRGEKR